MISFAPSFDAEILRTEGLSKDYGGVHANRDLSLGFERGKITALIGPNGAGKSTFVGLITGRIAASAGDVFFEGAKINHLRAHERIALGMAYTFQITSVFSGLSLWENVAIAARRGQEQGREALAARVSRALVAVGLEARAGQRACDQSYGHQRLLELAMGIVQAPRFFILDEPTQGLSAAEIQRFIKVIQALPDETTILLIEHNMDVVMQLAQKIAVLDQGQLLAFGAPEDVRNNDRVQAVYLGYDEV